VGGGRGNRGYLTRVVEKLGDVGSRPRPVVQGCADSSLSGPSRWSDVAEVYWNECVAEFGVRVLREASAESGDQAKLIVRCDRLCVTRFRRADLLDGGPEGPGVRSS